MNEMMKKIMKELAETNQNPFGSVDTFKAAAKKLGHSDEEIAKALENFDGFLLDEADLNYITGAGRIQILK